MAYTKEQMDAKWVEFENFLDQIDKEYADDLKEKGGIRWYILYGVFNNDITLNHADDLKPEIEKKVRIKLKELFP